MNAGSGQLCSVGGCRRLHGHGGVHSLDPSEAWAFLDEKDRNKIAKAGFATPRGGGKGAYQNHVNRSNRVIIPYERLEDTDLGLYNDGHVLRLLPDQYFQASGVPKTEFSGAAPAVVVGHNAFVLYRTHESFERFPPEPNWTVRALEKDGMPADKRGPEVKDTGHYVLRMPTSGPKPKRFEGPVQGIFAPEYADRYANYLSKCFLVWLIVHTKSSPYTSTQAGHLQAILSAEGLIDLDEMEGRGVVRHGLTSCPLCMITLSYSELHDTVSFDDAEGLTNAAVQIEGATRSTIVNLFHLQPLLYDELTHTPRNVGWGHAVCNTRLGQRICYSLHQLHEMDSKVGIVHEDGSVETFGWISDDWLMIRSPEGAVWIQLNGDGDTGAPDETETFDETDPPPDDAGVLE